MGSMNLGIYVKSMKDEEILKLCTNEIEEAIDNNLVDDASIFYDAIGFCPIHFPCGVFNSTDIWNFSGKIVTFSLECLVNLKNIVNNFDVYYCFGFENTDNVLKLIANASNVRTITKSEEDTKEFYRLTGNKPIGCLKDNKIISII